MPRILSGLPFPPPVDYVLSELSAMTNPSWLALPGMTYSFPELYKLLCHNEAMICNESQKHSILYWDFSSDSAGKDEPEKVINVHRISVLKAEKSSGYWLHNSENILKASELYT